MANLKAKTAGKGQQDTKGTNVPKNAFNVVMGALKGSKLYQEGKNFVETNFTEEGQRKKAFENTDFDSLDGMSADDQVNFVKGLRDKLPSGAKMADSFDTLGLDMSRTNEDGSYSIDGGSIGYGEGKALGLMSEDGSLDNDKLKEMISGNYDDYSDEQKAAIENVAGINKNIMNFAYDETGAKISQTDAGKNVEGFLSQIDEVDDLKKFQEGSAIDKASTMKDVVSGAMSNMATMDGAQIKLDSDSMEQYGAYSSMMEAAKNGELTSDMAKDYLTKAYGIENTTEVAAEDSVENGVEVNGKTITKDDLKELFNTKEGQAMMAEATDEWEQQMMDENPMLDRSIGKSKFDSIVRGAEAGMQAGYEGYPDASEMFSHGSDGMEDFTDLDNLGEGLSPDGHVITGEYRPARDAKLPENLPNASEMFKDKHAERVEQAEALSDGLENTGSESELQML